VLFEALNPSVTIGWILIIFVLSDQKTPKSSKSDQNYCHQNIRDIFSVYHKIVKGIKYSVHTLSSPFYRQSLLLPGIRKKSI
jgi:Na+-translocating ferredoxin:NAD+ oxidoreductase RnfC subunit